MQRRDVLGHVISTLKLATHVPHDRIILLPVSVTLFGLLSVHLGQDANFDLRNYHYYNVYALLGGRVGFDYAPAQIQSFFNPVADIPFYLLVTYAPPKVVGFAMGALHGINLYLLYLIGHHAFDDKQPVKRKAYSLGIASLGVYAPGFLSELGTTFNDNLTSLFILGATLLIVRRVKADARVVFDGTWPVLLLSGVLIGVAVGLKYTNVIYAIGGGVALLFLFHRVRDGILGLIVWSSGGLIGLAASAGYWMYLMLDRFKTPLFPFYNAIFRSPYYEPVNFASTHSRFLPQGFMESMFFPFYFAQTQNRVMEAYFRDARLAILYIVVVASVFVALRGARVRRASQVAGTTDRRLMLWLAVFLIVSYIVWQGMFAVYRYLMPIELLSPLLIAMLVTYHVSAHRQRSIIIAVLFAAIVLSVRIPNWGRVSWSDSFFGVTVPRVEVSGNPIVVIADREPTSYVIPSFPESMRFVRIVSSFTDPSKNNLFQMEMRELLEDAPAPIYVLSHAHHLGSVGDVIKQYRLRVKHEGCQPVVSRLETPGRELRLCGVDRME